MLQINMKSKYRILIVLLPELCFLFAAEAMKVYEAHHGNGKIIPRPGQNSILDWLPQTDSSGGQQLIVKILPEHNLHEASDYPDFVQTATVHPITESPAEPEADSGSEEDSSESDSSEENNAEELLLERATTVFPIVPLTTSRIEYTWVVTKRPRKILKLRQPRNENTTVNDLPPAKILGNATIKAEEEGFAGGSGVADASVINNVTFSASTPILRKSSSSGGKRVPPYNVRRIRPNEKVGPDGLNFFQIKRLSSFGQLWIKKYLTGRIDFGLVGDGKAEEEARDDSVNWEHRRYDRACLYEEYKYKRQNMAIPEVTSDFKLEVDRQNQVLGFTWLNWHMNIKEKPQSLEIATGEQGAKHPRYRTYMFLNLTTTIFRDKVCRNASSYAAGSYMFAPVGEGARANELGVDKKILPVEFVNQIFTLFIQLREMAMSMEETDYASDIDEEEILKGILAECQKDEPPIEWFSHSCADQVLSSDDPNNFACTLNEQYGFNMLISDPILDAMWQMFNSVYAYCFKYFQANLLLWHRYALIITNAFPVPVRKRWMASTAPKVFYKRLLGPDADVHLDTIQRCMHGTTLRSNITVLLPRFVYFESSRYGLDGYKSAL